MSFEEIAKSAYMAYSASTNNLDFRGEEMPAFKNLPKEIQIAWECGVRQSFVCFNTAGPSVAGTLDEQRWKAWTEGKLSE